MSFSSHFPPTTMSLRSVTTLLLALALPLHSLQLKTAPTFYNSNRGSAVRVPSSRTIGPWTRTRAAASSSSLTTLHLLKGLVPTIDDDIKREVADAEQSLFALFQRELDEGASIFAAIAAVRKRRKDKAGDYENKYKILSDYRSYSNKELLDTDHFELAPTLNDLNQQLPDKGKIVWATAPYRLSVFLGAFFFFPYLCEILNTLVVVTDDEFDIINEQFTPGIGILYGTFVALTLDILYERQGKVQENASVEASLLSQVTQNALNLFRDEAEIAREAAQIIADQVRIIVYRSRGSEMLSIMRADPYARLLSIVDHYQRDKNSFTPHQEALIDGLRSEIPSLMEARAKRLSDEASALPPTHFLVLIILTALSLIGFTAATLTITDGNGNPPLESRMVFAALSAVYVLFFNFCRDMNDPFDGVYQIKRSSAASYLLQIKWLIANQPFGADIKFDTRGLAPVYDGNEVTVEQPSASSELPPPPSETVSGGNKQLEPQQEEVATPIETFAPGVSINTVSSNVSRVNEALPKTPSAKDFMPERKNVPPKVGEQGQSKTTEEEMLSQFETLSGFSGDTPQGEGGVTVPAKKVQTGPIDKKKIAMNFRKAGGFGE
ncbi:hypothetical protein ACHAXR_012457 [Thalassiosira sp. AJA248-18]